MCLKLGKATFICFLTMITSCTPHQDVHSHASIAVFPPCRPLTLQLYVKIIDYNRTAPLGAGALALTFMLYEKPFCVSPALCAKPQTRGEQDKSSEEQYHWVQEPWCQLSPCMRDASLKHLLTKQNHRQEKNKASEEQPCWVQGP